MLVFPVFAPPVTYNDPLVTTMVAELDPTFSTFLGFMRAPFAPYTTTELGSMVDCMFAGHRISALYRGGTTINLYWSNPFITAQGDLDYLKIDGNTLAGADADNFYQSGVVSGSTVCRFSWYGMGSLLADGVESDIELALA